MFNGKFHTCIESACGTEAVIVKGFDTHQGGVWRHACLNAGSAVATYSAGTVRAVTGAVHRVVVVVNDIPSVMRIFSAAVP